MAACLLSLHPCFDDPLPQQHQCSTNEHSYRVFLNPEKNIHHKIKKLTIVKTPIDI
jgi:hypothetical protein